MLTITHTRAAGTLLEGTARADGTDPILKTNGCAGAADLVPGTSRPPVTAARPGPGSRPPLSSSPKPATR